MTDKALSLASRKVKEIEALIVSMFENGQSVTEWQRFLDLCEELDGLWAELDVSCWTLGMLSPWVPQEKQGEPTLAQLAGELIPFTPESKPDLWTWPTLRAAVEFAEKQQIIGRDQWAQTATAAEQEARKHPIAIRFQSQVDDFRRHLVDGLAEGDSVAQFKNRIRDTVDATEATVERNFRTSSKRAFLDGVGNVTRSNRFPYVKYVATMDNRTRPEHRAMDGRIIEVGTPEHAKALDLQREYNCRCTMIPLTAKQAEREGFKPKDAPKPQPEPVIRLPEPRRERVRPAPEPQTFRQSQPTTVNKLADMLSRVSTDALRDWLRGKERTLVISGGRILERTPQVEQAVWSVLRRRGAL